MLPHINFAVKSSPTFKTLCEGIGMFSSLSVFGEASIVMFQRSIMTHSERASFSRSFGMLSPSYPPPHLKQRAKSLPTCFQRYSSSKTALNDLSSQTCSERNHSNCGLSFHFDWIFNWTICLIMPWPISVHCFELTHRLEHPSDGSIATAADDFEVLHIFKHRQTWENLLN